MMKLTGNSFIEIDEMKLSMLIELMIVDILANGNVKKKVYIDDLI